jgi:pimeloyl-ACP methyl ester carboxylesterase
VLTFDNRGMASSQPMGTRITVAQMALDTLELMNHVGWPSAHVVGHSLGGPVALEMALNQPGRVRSLSLLCTVARGRDATRLTGRMLWLGLRSRLGSRSARRRAAYGKYHAWLSRPTVVRLPSTVVHEAMPTV